MFDPDDIDAPDIFGDLGRDAMKVVGPLALLLFAPVLLLIAAFGGLPDAIETNAAPASAAEIPPDHLAVMQQVSNQTGIPGRSSPPSPRSRAASARTWAELGRRGRRSFAERSTEE